MAKITLGPIIGKVTDTTARLLIEVDDNIEVTCEATPAHGGALTQTVDSITDRPIAFQFDNLAPATEYTLTFKGVSAGYPKGRIRTFSSNTDSLNVAAVSCNFLGRRGRNDLWADLRDRYVMPGDVDLILHLGDQIYGDSAFARALRIIHDKEFKTRKGQDDAIREAYRRLYRAWWSYQATRDVLANVSNLMIWDDHEIRDDWGSRDTDCDPNSVEFRIGMLARQVYREYQRQLWDDINPTTLPNTGEEQHHHVWGPIGVLFVDQRGGRSFGREPARPYLSTQQWEKIVHELEKGHLSKVRALIVVTSVPLCYLGAKTTSLGTSYSDDLYDHWSHPQHAKEQIEMIRILRLWKEARPGQRELLVVGGDVHVGGHTHIEHAGATIFKQLITSPISNTPPKWYEFFGLKVLTETEERLSSSYSYEHHDLTNQRNYGVILVRVPTTGMPRVEGSLVKET
jgi:phosphodiesterase/alkaline phosphatase D-like protein